MDAAMIKGFHEEKMRQFASYSEIMATQIEQFKKDAELMRKEGDMQAYHFLNGMVAGMRISKSNMDKIRSNGTL